MVMQTVPIIHRSHRPRKRMTRAEFLAWADEDVCAEWVKGEVIYWPATEAHQKIVGFVYRLMQEYVEQKDLGTVLTAPYPMHLAAAHSIREPDVLYVAREN